jgi:SAM-dependent methyltransferase
MSKSYEELMGAVGRAVFYRPERRRVRDLLSRDARPQLLVSGREVQLFDVSMNGISFLTGENHSSWQVGQELAVRLLLRDKEIYAGQARVARVEPGSRGRCRVGVGLVTGFLDLPEVRREDDEGQLERDLSAGPEATRERIPVGFREQVGRAVHFLQYYRRVLGRNEARYREFGLHGAEAVRSLTERALTSLREPWAEIQQECSRASVECLQDLEVLLAAKEYTETVVTPVMMEVPLVHRAYTKPLGYPGDYQVMLYYYNNRPEGDSVYAQVFHKLGVEHPLSAGVRTRKDYVIELMEEEHDRVCAAGADEPAFRVTSLACGPAREVSDYIPRRRGWPGSVTWTLIDQEDEALSIAYHDAVRALSQVGARGSLQCLHLSFVQMLRDPTVVASLEPQHFIFSTGFFDYLREAQAQSVLRGLYERLTPGGLLVIGNALGPNEHFWSAEFILDWTLLYRTRDEMRRLAARLPETAEVDVAAEPGNAYYFLLVRRH